MRNLFALATSLLIFQGALALPAGWKEIAPGGNTMCARGRAYKFLVHAGDPKKVLVSFAGGGACWDDFTCASRQIFTDTAERTYGPINSQTGIYNLNDANNPYRGWTQIYIPYCTGDVHLGSEDTTYVDANGKDFVIHHRGGYNTRAALAWLAKSYPRAQEVSVNGCSAGSYGSIMWAPFISEIYKNAKFQQFGDSGAGISPSLYFDKWGFKRSLPHWVPGLDPNSIDWDKLTLTDVYHRIAQHYPQAHFSQFNHEADYIQTLFYSAMGGDDSEWSQRMFKSMEDISAVTANFNYFAAPGNNHCAITTANFYNIKSDSVKLRDWHNSTLFRKDFQNVKCLECKTR